MEHPFCSSGFKVLCPYSFLSSQTHLLVGERERVEETIKILKETERCLLYPRLELDWNFNLHRKSQKHFIMEFCEVNISSQENWEQTLHSYREGETVLHTGTCVCLCHLCSRRSFLSRVPKSQPFNSQGRIQPRQRQLNFRVGSVAQILLSVQNSFHATPANLKWVKVKGRAGTGDIIVGVCYRAPNQEDDVNESLQKQIGVASRLPVLVLLGDFNHPDICWRNTCTNKPVGSSNDTSLHK